MILMRGIHITRGIGRIVLKVEPSVARAIPGPKTGETFNTTIAIPQVMWISRLKIITQGAV